MEAAGAVDAQNAPTAPWKTHRTGFPQLPQAIIILANDGEVTARLCHVPDREAVSLRLLILLILQSWLLRLDSNQQPSG